MSIQYVAGVRGFEEHVTAYVISYITWKIYFSSVHKKNLDNFHITTDTGYIQR